MDETNMVKVHFSGQLTEKDSHCLSAIKKALGEYKIPFETICGTADIWARDYMPIQIGPNTFVAYIYKPDYLCNKTDEKFITKQFYTEKSINKIPKDKRCDVLYQNCIEIVNCDLILDGRNIVVCGDRIILTDKVFIENRPKSKNFVIGELKRAFGKEVVIIPSDPYEIEKARKRYELPLCHADGVLAPIDSDSILIADYGEDPLGYVPQLMNALSPYFKPKNIKHFDFSRIAFEGKVPEEVWVYINFLRIGDLILVPQLGGRFEKYDKEAIEQLKKIFITDNVHGINTRILSLGEDENGEKVNHDNCGGALHCITWEVISKP